SLAEQIVRLEDTIDVYTGVLGMDYRNRAGVEIVTGGLDAARRELGYVMLEVYDNARSIAQKGGLRFPHDVNLLRRLAPRAEFPQEFDTPEIILNRYITQATPVTQENSEEHRFMLRLAAKADERAPSYLSRLHDIIRFEPRVATEGEINETYDAIIKAEDNNEAVNRIIHQLIETLGVFPIPFPYTVLSMIDPQNIELANIQGIDLPIALEKLTHAARPEDDPASYDATIISGEYRVIRIADMLKGLAQEMTPRQLLFIDGFQQPNDTIVASHTRRREWRGSFEFRYPPEYYAVFNTDHPMYGKPGYGKLVRETIDRFAEQYREERTIRDVVYKAFSTFYDSRNGLRSAHELIARLEAIKAITPNEVRKRFRDLDEVFEARNVELRKRAGLNVSEPYVNLPLEQQVLAAQISFDYATAYVNRFAELAGYQEAPTFIPFTE
ncbi:MAG: hypothetical protein ACREGI_03520, partial [Candidatus Levyibacteriota bacterium]